MDLREKFVVRPGTKVKLDKFDPGSSLGFGKKAAVRHLLRENISRLSELEYLLYAGHKRALLVILQGMDAAGKDATIRHVMSGVNPQNCKITSFKVPSAEEGAHDFLWRIHKAVPAKGEIGIFNRSQYEEVLAARVRGLVPKSVWSRRFNQINTFEKILVENDIVILKFFLNVSKKEQKKRLKERITDPTKLWKVDPVDFEERKRWDQYMEAYEDVLRRCSTEWAPWFVIPADKKWFRNFAVSQIIVKCLEDMDLRFPTPKFDPKQIKVE